MKICCSMIRRPKCESAIKSQFKFSFFVALKIRKSPSKSSKVNYVLRKNLNRSSVSSSLTWTVFSLSKTHRRTARIFHRFLKRVKFRVMSTYFAT